MTKGVPGIPKNGPLVLELSNRDQRPITVKAIHCAAGFTEPLLKVRVLDVDTQYGNYKRVRLESSESCTFTLDLEPAFGELKGMHLGAFKRSVLAARLCLVIRLTTGERFVHRLSNADRRFVVERHLEKKWQQILCRLMLIYWKPGKQHAPTPNYFWGPLVSLLLFFVAINILSAIVRFIRWVIN